MNDIQRFFMIMAPTSRPKAPFRLHIIGKKRLPIPDKHERFFCFTEATAGKVIGTSPFCIAHMLLVTLTLVYSELQGVMPAACNSNPVTALLHLPIYMHCYIV